MYSPMYAIQGYDYHTSVTYHLASAIDFLAAGDILSPVATYFVAYDIW